MIKKLILLSILNWLSLVGAYSQKIQGSEDLGDILLQVDSWEGEVSATQFLAIYKNGEFLLESLKVDEDYVWIKGGSSHSDMEISLKGQLFFWPHGT